MRRASALDAAAAASALPLQLLLLLPPLAQLQQCKGDAALWNDVLAHSCPHEFNPARQAATDAEQDYIGMWVGHEYDRAAMREGRFTEAKVTAFNNQPWAEAVACGAMVKYSDLSADCQSVIRQVRSPSRRWWA